MTTRRSILSVLFASPLAKLWPKSVKSIQSKVGQAHPVCAVEHVERERPYPMPTAYLRRHTDVLTMAELQVHCMGNPFNQDSVILADQFTHREIWSSIAPADRWAVTESELAKRGFFTFSLFGAEVVLDHGLKEREIWLIDPKHPDCLALNNLLTFGPSTSNRVPTCRRPKKKSRSGERNSRTTTMKTPKTNRRGFLATLLAGLGLAKYVKSNIGPKPPMAHVSELAEWPADDPNVKAIIMKFRQLGVTQTIASNIPEYSWNSLSPAMKRRMMEKA